jgi:DNA-binding NarL/FixJ family response regulator
VAIRVLVVDDDPMVREGLVAILESQADIDVVGEAQAAEAALELVVRLQPDVVLADVSLPDLDGIAATRQMKHLQPGVAVICLAVYGHQVLEALTAGASRYLRKDCPVDELLGAIRACWAAQRAHRPSA